MQSSFIRTTFMVLGLVVAFAFVPFISGLLPDVAAQPVLSPGDSVTGHVEFQNAANNFDRYSLSAIRHRDGSVSGEVEEHVESPEGAFVRSAHGTIICFSISANTARISGIVDHITVAAGTPPTPGTPFVLTVVDNGQGNSDLPDLATTPATPSTIDLALGHCSTTPINRPLFPVIRGNIQVRSGS